MTADTRSLPDPPDASLAQARAEYQEYFAVRDELDINVIPMAPDASLPTHDDFLQQAPAVFRLASDIQVVDPTALTQLRSLGNAAQIIADVLNQQNQKLTALLSYLLRNEDNPEHRTHGFEYGGAGVGFYMPRPLTLGQLVEIKIFLPDESTAVYCIGQIIECDEVEDADVIPSENLVKTPPSSTTGHEDDSSASSGTNTGINAGISTGTSAGISADISTDISTDISAGTSAGISADISTDISAGTSPALGYRLKALFKRISDSDRELLIRACMHAQSRLLKKRANERQESP